MVVKFKVCENHLGQYHSLRIFKCSPQYSTGVSHVVAKAAENDVPALRHSCSERGQ